MNSIIELEDVCKEFKILNKREGIKGSFLDLFSRNYECVKAVNNISLSITSGEVVGFLGKNGAGKSTTIKMLTGILKPSSGKILINGYAPEKERKEVASNIGVVFGQRTQLWWSLPVIESFNILKSIYMISDIEYKNTLEYFDALVDVGKLYGKTVRELSLGQRVLCDILAAFLHNPAIVFLDEPTIGLDISMKRKIHKLIADLNKERQTTILLTTHDMEDVDALCKRVVIIDQGSVIFDDSISKMKELFGEYKTLSFVVGNSIEGGHLKGYSREEGRNILVDIENGLTEILSGKVIVNGSPITNKIDVVLTNNDVLRAMGVIQNLWNISDVSITDISTESIVKKIYERSL